MSVINLVVDAVIAMAQATNPYSTVTRGPLPEVNSIVMELAAGSASSTFFNKGMAYSLDVVCNGKHENQQSVSETLNNIHEVLVKAKSYPSGTGFQITNIVTNGAPTRIEREANNQWLYGSGLTVTFYYR